MLAEILTGGKTSRLYRALVDSGKTLGVSTHSYELKDPALFLTYVFLKPDSDHAKIEKMVKDEYQKICDKGVTAAELARAKKYIRIDTANQRNGVYSLFVFTKRRVGLLAIGLAS